jgi:hypothetical protein
MTAAEWAALLVAIAGIVIAASGGGGPLTVLGIVLIMAGVGVGIFSSLPSAAPPNPGMSTTPAPSATVTIAPSVTTVMSPTAPPPAPVQYLTDLQSSNRTYNVIMPADVTISGIRYTRSISAPHELDEGDVIFTLARRYHHLSTVAGITDASPSGTSARLDIYGDGRQLFSAVVTKGNERQISELDITGVFELKLVVAPVGPPLPFGSDFATPQGVFGDPSVQ